MARLDVLSCPTEHFNADEFGTTTLKYNPGRDIYEVFDIVAGKNCTNAGIFGFKMSYFDLEEFEREAPLLEAVMPGETHFISLTRRNFVAQAISLYMWRWRAGSFRAIGATAEQRSQRPPTSVPYDDSKIMRWAWPHPAAGIRHRPVAGGQ